LLIKFIENADFDLCEVRKIIAFYVSYLLFDEINDDGVIHKNQTNKL
jgi:hypothetical protein